VLLTSMCPVIQQRTKELSFRARCTLAFVSALCHALRMSIKHTKSEKAQKADELEKRQNVPPEENETKPIEREEPSRADIDSVRH
jgi:hypothetical protein